MLIPVAKHRALAGLVAIASQYVTAAY